MPDIKYLRPRLMALTVGMILFSTSDAGALRLMTYNVLNYSSGRTAVFQSVLQETDPDVLFVQEISSAGVTNYRNTILEVVHPGEWVSGPFVDGPDTDSAIFYRDARVTLEGHFVISTTLRDIDEWTFRPVGYTSSDANVRAYVVHLKASQGSTNEQRRLDEVTEMRTRMETFPPGQNYIVTGDFNIYRSSEPAYQYMLSTSAGLSGVVQDPINRPGTWHNLASFASIHTQSPRVTQFGGGANGGLDDRFDIILVAPNILDGEGFDYIPSTYTAFGQDGLHFNSAVNAAPPNGVVSQAVADALHDASDHLPVFADFQIPAILVADASLSLGSVIVGGLAAADLGVANGALAPADELTYSLAAPPSFGAPPGTFEAQAEVPGNQHSITLDTAVAGSYAGPLTIASDAPDDPSFDVALTGTVLDHAVPSVLASSPVTEAILDFGTHAPGQFADEEAEAHNFDFDTLQAWLEVYSAEFVGDVRFSIVGGFTPATIGPTPATWTVGFDDAGAGDGLYEATLTLRTRDQQDLSGAIDLTDLVFDLRAVVDAATSIPELAIVPSTTILQGVFPNPFRPSTRIRFGLPREEAAQISIVDVGGRVIRRLVSGSMAAGWHQLVWDGRDDAGSQVPAGVYRIRLQTPGRSFTRTVVRIR